MRDNHSLISQPSIWESLNTQGFFFFDFWAMDIATYEESGPSIGRIIRAVAPRSLRLSRAIQPTLSVRVTRAADPPVGH